MNVFDRVKLHLLGSLTQKQGFSLSQYHKYVDYGIQFLDFSLHKCEVNFQKLDYLQKSQASKSALLFVSLNRRQVFGKMLEHF